MKAGSPEVEKGMRPSTPESPVRSITTVTELAQACGAFVTTSSPINDFRTRSSWDTPITQVGSRLGDNSFASSSVSASTLGIREARIRGFYEAAQRHRAVRILVKRYGNCIGRRLSFSTLKHFVRNSLLCDDEMHVKSIESKYQILVAVVRIILEMNWDIEGAQLLGDFAVEGIVTKALFPPKSCCW